MRFKPKLWGLVVVSAVLLTSCGGGGGTPPTPLAFASGGPIQKTYGDAAFTNSASGGAGTGAITYASGNTGVATVGATTGTVTIVGAGSSTISATKAADSSNSSQVISYSLSVAKAAQILTLSATPVDMLVGQSVAAPIATNSGPGTLSFTSDNGAVITVDPNSGALTALTPGSAHITITKAGDANYNPVQATFTANSSTVQVHAWIGSNDTLVDIAPEVSGASLYRSTDQNCNLAAYKSCANG